MKLNADWHKEHKMPKNPTLDERIDWHSEHVRYCGCRPLTAKLKDELEKRRVLDKNN